MLSLWIFFLSLSQLLNCNYYTFADSLSKKKKNEEVCIKQKNSRREVIAAVTLVVSMSELIIQVSGQNKLMSMKKKK